MDSMTKDEVELYEYVFNVMLNENQTECTIESKKTHYKINHNEDKYVVNKVNSTFDSKNFMSKNNKTDDNY
jgi:hypothetical protein